MNDNDKQNNFVSANPAPLMLEYRPRPPVLVTLQALDLRLNKNYPTINYTTMNYPIPQKYDPDEFRNFILNNYEKTSTEQHYDDAVEFFVCISKYYNIFNKLRDDFIRYIEINKITNKEQQHKMFDDILCDSSEFNTARLELRKYRSKFLREYRDEYSVVNKLMDIYNYKDINIESTKQAKLIKDQLDSYLGDKIKPMYFA